MKKFIKITGRLGAATLIGSVIFKILHWMGAPTLLFIGTVSTGLFIIAYVIQKLQKK
ncbi:MAG: hypothetical protein L7S65_06220 [Schleiferiaceae bacterium]|nr:hypothetical protein [Schleiferiaceae bacterium]